MLTIANGFREKLVHLARKYSKGTGLDPEDMISELIMLAHAEDWKVKPTKCRRSGHIAAVDPAHINRFLASRAADIRRREIRRRKKAVVQATFDHLPAKALRTAHSEDEMILVLSKNLTHQQLHIVLLKMVPDATVLRLAERDHKRKYHQTTGLAREIVVYDRHIAERLHISEATVSRATTSARNALVSSGFATHEGRMTG